MAQGTGPAFSMYGPVHRPPSSQSQVPGPGEYGVGTVTSQAKKGFSMYAKLEPQRHETGDPGAYQPDRLLPPDGRTDKRHASGECICNYS
jgi:hypothetical protein